MILSGFTFLFILCVIFQNALTMDADEDFKTQNALNLYHIALSIDPVESFLSSYYENSKMEVDKVFCNQLKEYCHKQTLFYDTILRGDHTQISLQAFCAILSKMIGDQVLCRVSVKLSP